VEIYIISINEVLFGQHVLYSAKPSNTPRICFRGNRDMTSWDHNINTFYIMWLFSPSITA